MTPKSKLWMAAGLVLILLAAASILANTIYLPQISKYPTYTPTLTSTATQTATATNTATATKSATPTRTATLQPGVYIQDIIYAPSSDPLDEYVLIKNTGSNSVNMKDWWIKVETDSTLKYTFPNFSLGGGKSVRVWTKIGNDTTSDLYWDRTTQVWNDKRDCAYLRNEDDYKNVFCYGY